MIIRGILDSSLNGQLCIRGFAPIKELARVSSPNYKYQRKPLAEQEETIRYFLDTEPFLFFPEIILSLKIKHSFDDKKNTSTPLEQIQKRKLYRSSVDKTIIQVKTTDYKLSNDSGGKNKVNIVEIAMDDNILNELIEKKQHPFHRIDGNHRLKAAELTKTEKVNRMVAPFCIILGEEFYQNDNLVNHPSTNDFEKAIMIYFHNINTKTVPLTSEENLRVIISEDNEIKFSDAELEDILGYQGVVTRKLLKDSGYLKVFPILFNALHNNERTWILKAIETLIHRNVVRKTALSRVVLNALSQINSLLNTNQSLNVNKAVFVSLVYYFSQTDKGKADLYPKWLVGTGNGNINFITPENLIDLFEEHTSKSINIFVAMPSFGAREIKAYNKAYQNVVDKIVDKNPTLKLHLFPVMQHKGKSFDLSQNLFDRIDKSGIVIVDITDSNPNVIYELGYAKSANKHRIIVCEQTYFKKVPFDFEHDLRRSYPKTALTELEEIVYTDLVAILKDEYKLIIKE